MSVTHRQYGEMELGVKTDNACG